MPSSKKAIICGDGESVPRKNWMHACRRAGLVGGLLVLLSLGAGTPATVHAQASGGQEAFNQGLSAMRKQDHSAAVAHFTKSLGYDPRSIGARMNRSECYYRMNRTDLALKDANAVIRQDPRFARGYLGRGTIYFRQGELDRAMEDAEQSITLDPELAPGYALRGKVYYARKQRTEALREFDRAIKLDVTDTGPLFNRALLYGDLGRHDDAIADLKLLIELQPTDFGSRLQLVQCYGRKRDFAAGVAACTTIIEVQPNIPDSYHYRALFYVEQENYEKAIADFGQAIALSQESAVSRAKSFAARGALHSDRREYKFALADLNESIRLSPKDLQTWQWRVALFARMGDMAKAAEEVEILVKTGPGDPSSYFHRGKVRSLQKDFVSAITDFSKAIELNASYAPAYAGRGMAYHRLQNAEAAKADLDKAVQLDPQLPDAYGHRAAVCLDQGDEEGARINATLACETSYWKDPINLGLLAGAFDLAGNYDEAIKWLEKGIARGLPAFEEEKARQLLEKVRARKAARMY